MKVSEIQAALNATGFKPPLALDGISGRKTMKAVDLFLSVTKGVPSTFSNWTDARRLIATEQAIYADLGIEVGVIDGLVGEQTRWARTVYDGRGKDKRVPNVAVESWRDKIVSHPAPEPKVISNWPRQSEVPKFFGEPESNQTMLELPFPMRLAWEPEKIIHRVSCHAKVSGALQRIWLRAVEHYGYDQLCKLRLDMFGGCLNNRNMRGSSAKSMHAWGIAWDVDPDRNQLKWGRDLASLDEAAYIPFWSFVEFEGAISLGRLRNYDWMHFQFARL